MKCWIFGLKAGVIVSLKINIVNQVRILKGRSGDETVGGWLYNHFSKILSEIIFSKLAFPPPMMIREFDLFVE
jgi:hypothetical protein